tara:strand:- start:229 stop:1170 length:942 start_codon:yes stop_codon:yes gene_type:complete
MRYPCKCEFPPGLLKKVENKIRDPLSKIENHSNRIRVITETTNDGKPFIKLFESGLSRKEKKLDLTRYNIEFKYNPEPDQYKPSFSTINDNDLYELLDKYLNDVKIAYELFDMINIETKPAENLRRIFKEQARSESDSVDIYNKTIEDGKEENQSNGVVTFPNIKKWLDPINDDKKNKIKNIVEVKVDFSKVVGLKDLDTNNTEYHDNGKWAGGTCDINGPTCLNTEKKDNEIWPKKTNVGGWKEFNYDWICPACYKKYNKSEGNPQSEGGKRRTKRRNKRNKKTKKRNKRRKKKTKRRNKRRNKKKKTNKKI